MSVRQTDGTMARTWTPDVAKWRANVRRLQGQELFEAQQIQGEATHEAVGRYRSGLARKHRFVKSDGTILDIVSIDNVEDRNVTLKVRCKQRL